MSTATTLEYRNIPVEIYTQAKWFLGCKCSKRLLKSGARLLRAATEAAAAAGMSVRGGVYSNFRGAGATALLVLAESHAALHTWPERQMAVHLELSLCNLGRDNADRVSKLLTSLEETFQADEVRSSRPLENAVVEYRRPGYGYFLIADRDWARQRSQYQFIHLFQNRSFGNVLCLDGLYQTSDLDEWTYHELLAQVPALVHHNPRQALVVGGGDGGAASHLLAHPTVQSCTLVEIDPAVVEVSRQWLEGVHRRVWDNARLSVVISDGKKYLQSTTRKYDLIIADLTDPIGAARPLFTASFYRTVTSALAPAGLFATHCGFPFSSPQGSRGVVEHLRAVFPFVHLFHGYIPLYGAEMLFALCGMQEVRPNARRIARRIAARGLEPRLKGMNADYLVGRFALPTWMAAIVAG
jgi:spermidine synthase